MRLEKKEFYVLRLDGKWYIQEIWAASSTTYEMAETLFEALVEAGGDNTPFTVVSRQDLDFSPKLGQMESELPKGQPLFSFEAAQVITNFELSYAFTQSPFVGADEVGATLIGK